MPVRAKRKEVNMSMGVKDLTQRYFERLISAALKCLNDMKGKPFATLIINTTHLLVLDCIKCFREFGLFGNINQ